MEVHLTVWQILSIASKVYQLYQSCQKWKEKQESYDLCNEILRAGCADVYEFDTAKIRSAFHLLPTEDQAKVKKSYPDFFQTLEFLEKAETQEMLRQMKRQKYAVENGVFLSLSGLGSQLENAGDDTFLRDLDMAIAGEEMKQGLQKALNDYPGASITISF